MFGTCKYCGQLSSISNQNITTEEQANEYASLNCDCPDSVAYREHEEAEKRAADNRNQALNRAKEQIEDLFGSGAAGYGLISIDDKIRNLMYDAAVLVYDADIKDITINISSCVKVKISKSPKGKIIFMRSDAAVFKQEA